MVRLRPLRPDDETEFRAAHQQMADEGLTFGLGLEQGLPWEEYLRLLADARAGVNLPSRHVPSTFLAADVENVIVGRVSIRHHLNEFLLREGGHIGYSVLPAHRRRGYATQMLRQSLVIVRSLGVDRALVTCDDDNIGSIAVIESCGGRLENVAPPEPGAALVRRYWIG